MTAVERADYDYALRRIAEERATEIDTASEGEGQSKELFTTTRTETATTPD